MLDKIQHISFTSEEEAIKVAEFLKSLGYKLNKNCFVKSTYIIKSNDPVFNRIFGNHMIYNGFTKYNNEWKLSNNSEIFTFITKAKTLIRREKLKKLNELKNN